MLKQEKKKVMKKYKVDYVRVLLIIAVVYFVITFANQQLQINEYNVKLKDVDSQIQASEVKSEELKLLDDKTNDSDYIESMAREELGLVKPYEKIFVDVNK